MQDQIVKYTKDNSEVFVKLLKSLKPVEDAVHSARSLCLRLNPNNLDGVKELSIQVTGYWMQLKELYEKVNSLKKNKELAYYMHLRSQAESEETKFVDAQATKQASFYVAEERRVRDYIYGLLEASDCCLKTCRNLINEKKYGSQTSSDTED